MRLGAGIAILVMAGIGWAQVTERVSVDWMGAQSVAGGNLIPGSSVSADGRYVIFTSDSDYLVPGDTNGTWDLFVRDRLSRKTERVSVATGGAQANGFSSLYGFWITSDGRYVAFESLANNLVSGDTNGAGDVFLRDRRNGTTERLSVATGGAQGNAQSQYPSIAADGRYVAFSSDANDLVPGDTNVVFDIFVRDRLNGTTERVSISDGGAQGDLHSSRPYISGDGRYVGFESGASNLVPGDINGAWDVFVHDRVGGITECVSIAAAGTQGNGDSYSASISADGRYVAFASVATNLVPGDTNGTRDVFVRDRQSGTTERVSVDAGGAQISYGAGDPSISADGSYVAFSAFQLFVRDRLNGTTELVSLSNGGSQANGICDYPGISSGGRYVAFRSSATNLVAGDTNSRDDVFLHDRHASSFETLCEPGVGGVNPCPCSNPPSGPGRGCDNSTSTGGASLSAGGIAYLAMDSLVFSTVDQSPTSTSILFQSNVQIPAGVAFGQGVRCAAGELKRLYVKPAVGGGITAPDLGAGDPTVSARSASLGASIQAGQSRFYLVVYRDPAVVGGCSATSTFNATQTGRVTWWP